MDNGFLRFEYVCIRALLLLNPDMPQRWILHPARRYSRPMHLLLLLLLLHLLLTGFVARDTARENMLMRYSKVTLEGKYVPPPPANSKASFSTMTYVRATIVEDAGEYLARAVTIAVRVGGSPLCLAGLSP